MFIVNKLVLTFVCIVQTIGIYYLHVCTLANVRTYDVTLLYIYYIDTLSIYEVWLRSESLTSGCLGVSDAVGYFTPFLNEMK